MIRKPTAKRKLNAKLKGPAKKKKKKIGNLDIIIEGSEKETAVELALIKKLKFDFNTLYDNNKKFKDNIELKNVTKKTLKSLMNDMIILGSHAHRTMIESCCKIANLEFEQGTDFDTLCLLYIESKINFNVDFYPSIFNESMTKSIIKKPSMTNDNLINDFMTLTNDNTKLTENIDTNEFDLIAINDFMTLTKDDKKLTENIDTKKIDLIPINIPEKITIYDNMTFEQQQQSETANILMN